MGQEQGVCPPHVSALMGVKPVGESPQPSLAEIGQRGHAHHTSLEASFEAYRALCDEPDAAAFRLAWPILIGRHAP